MLPRLQQVPDPELILVLDGMSSQDETGLFPARPETRRAVMYLSQILRKRVLAVPSAPVIGKPDAKVAREHADWLIEQLPHAAPVALLGAGSVYGLRPHFPDSIRSLTKWNKLRGRVFELLGRKAVVTHSLSSLYAGKNDDTGGYLSLRTIAEDLSLLFRPDVDERGSYRQARHERDLYPLAQLPAGSLVGLDIETTGLNFQTDRLLTVQFSWQDRQGLTAAWELLTPTRWQQLFQKLTALGLRFCMANGKFDCKFLKREGIELLDWDDIQAMHVLLDERESTHNLDFIARQVLGEGKYHVETSRFEAGDVAAFSAYAARDADLQRRIARELLPHTESRQSYAVLRRAAHALSEAEYYGTAVDSARLAALRREVGHLLSGAQEQLSAHGLRSPSDNRGIAQLFQLTGSTDKAALSALDVPLARTILDARGLAKINKTYLARIQAGIQFDGRYHADYRLAGPMTGRLSCGSGLVETGQEWQSINMQNIPRSAKSGQVFASESERIRAELRSLFVADEGHLLLGVDYAAAEARVAASLCGDERFIRDMNEKFDTHSYFAVMGFKLPVDMTKPGWVEQVKRDHAFQRQAAKTAFFARLYGAGAEKIGASITGGLNREENLAVGTPLARAISERYPGLDAWIEDVKRQMRRDSRLTSLWGRERIFPIATGVFDRQHVGAMEREGVNFLIQSLASDACLRALGSFDAKYRSRGWRVLQFVHDSILAQVPEADGEEALAALVDEMQTSLTLPATLYAEGGVGRHWGEV